MKVGVHWVNPVRRVCAERGLPRGGDLGGHPPLPPRINLCPGAPAPRPSNRNLHTDRVTQPRIQVRRGQDNSHGFAS